MASFLIILFVLVIANAALLVFSALGKNRNINQL